MSDKPMMKLGVYAEWPAALAKLADLMARGYVVEVTQTINDGDYVYRVEAVRLAEPKG